MAEPQTLSDLDALGAVEERQPQTLDDLLSLGAIEEEQPTKVLTFEDDNLTYSAPASTSDIDVEYIRHIQKAEKDQEQSIFGAGIGEFFTTLGRGLTIDPIKQFAETLHQDNIERSNSFQLDLIKGLAKKQLSGKPITLETGKELADNLLKERLKTEEPLPVLKGAIESADFLSKKIDKFKKDNGIIRPDTKWAGFLFDLSSVTASIMTSVGTFMATKSPAATATVFALLQDSQVYKEGRAAGLTPKEAATVAAQAGAAEGALEFVGLKIFNLLKIRPTKFRRIMERSINEGFQELTQTSAEIAITTAADIREFDAGNAAKDVGYSFFLGLIGGGATNIAIESASSLGKKRGLSKQETDKVIESVQKNLDEITESFIESVEADANDASLDLQKSDITESQNIADKFSDTGELDTTKYTDLIKEAKKLQEIVKKEEKKAITVEKKISEIGGRISEVKKQIQTGLSKISGVTEENISDVLSAFQFAAKKAKKPSETLISFLRKRGGLIDEGGKLKSFDAPKTLIKNKTGENLDDATLAAFEAGFFPDFDTRPDINDLLNAIQDELSGAQERFRVDPTDFLLLQEDISRADQALNEIGIKLEDKADIKKITTLQKKIAKLQEGIGEKEVEKFVSERKQAVLKEFIKKIPSAEKLAKMEVKDAQNTLVNIIKGSGISLKEQGKFLSAIKNTQTIEQLQKQLPSIRERIETAIQRESKNVIKKRIKRILKSARIKQQSGKPVGKFVADVQRVFDKVIDISKNNQDVNRSLLDNLPENTEAMETIALRHFGGVATVEESQRLLEFLSDLKEFGAAVRLSKDTKRLIEVAEAKDKVFSDITNDGKAKKKEEKETSNLLMDIIKFSKLGSYNWETLVNILTQNKKIKAGESETEKLADVIKERTKERDLTVKFQNLLFDVGQKIFGLDVREFRQKLDKDRYEIHQLGNFINARGEAVGLEMTIGQARKRFMEMRDPTLKDRIFGEKGNAYTEEMARAIKNILTPEDIEFSNWQIDTYYKLMYNQTNPIYANRFGVDLPRNDNYSPIRTAKFSLKQEKNLFFIDEFKQRAGVSPSAIKSRTAIAKPLEDMDDLETLTRHSRDMIHFIAFSDKVRFLNSVFGSEDIISAMNDFFPGIEQDITKFIEDFGNNNRQVNDEIENSIEQFRRNFVTAKLGLKPSLMIKQLLSIPAYAETISTVEFSRGLIEFIGNPQKAINILNKSNLMRLRGDDFSIELQNLTKGRSRKVQKAITISMKPIVVGDRVAIYAGGWTVYSAAIRRGMTEKQALAEFERVTARTQQSTDLEQKAAFARGGAFKRTLTTFLSSPIQYFNREMWALRNLKSGKLSAGEATKIIAIYHFILPMLFQYVSDGFEWEEDNQKRAAILGSFNGWLIVNDAIAALLKSATGLGFYGSRQELFDFVTSLGGALKETVSNNFYDASRDVADGIGAVTGIPLQRGFDIYESGVKISKGDVEQGVFQALGFPKSVAEKK